MKRKGFTLVELLTIICILGVIILIAVPNITKLVAETKKKIFYTSSTNLIKTMEKECKSNLITKDRTTLSYTIINGKIDTNLDVKGTIPDDGYVILDNKCNVKDYYLNYDDFVFSNGEDIRQDYMLKAPTEENTSILKTLYPSYYDNIVTVNFINNITVPEEAIEVKDPSVSDGGKIKSWLIEDSGNYNLYVGSEKIIFSNFNSQYLFKDMNNVTNIDFHNLNTSFTTNIKEFFSNLQNITYIDVSSFDTSNVTIMQNLFLNCKMLTNIDVSNWDTSNVADMRNMFFNCNNLTSLDVSNWNTSNVADMGYMFYNCNNLTSLDLGKWDTGNVADMKYMFYECNNLTSLDVSNFNTSNVADMGHMFYYCNNLTSLDVSNFNTSNVADMQYMFYRCIKLTSLDVSNFNTSNVDDVGYMFYNCNKLTSLDLSNWDTSKVDDMKYMFYNCNNLTSLDVSNWDTSSATNMMSYMFYKCELLAEITMNNSDYYSINNIISELPTRTTDSMGTLNITGIDDISQVNTAKAESKYWNLVV